MATLSRGCKPRMVKLPILAVLLRPIWKPKRSEITTRSHIPLYLSSLLNEAVKSIGHSLFRNYYTLRSAHVASVGKVNTIELIAIAHKPFYIATVHAALKTTWLLVNNTKRDQYSQTRAEQVIQRNHFIITAVHPVNLMTTWNIRLR